MKRSRLLLPALCLLVLACGAGALYLGPPREQPPPKPVPQTPGGAAPAAAVPNWAGSRVRSFGPVPQCGDEAATAAIMGLLRDKAGDRVLGLANVHVAGHSQIGDLVEWDCDAQVQLGGGQRSIRYQVNQLTSGRELWEITISAASTP